jgi:hypothetical protein
VVVAVGRSAGRVVPCTAVHPLVATVLIQVSIFYADDTGSRNSGFKQEASADVIVRGHALVRNLRNGFSALTVAVPVNLRLAVAWPQLAQSI